MAQWFHRNPMKASGVPNFDLGPVATSIDARMVCREIAEKRAALIKMFGDATANKDSLIQSANQYIGLLMGFVEAPDTSSSSADILTDDESEDESEDKNKDEEAEGGDVTNPNEKDKQKKTKKKPAVPEKPKGPPPSLRRVVLFTWCDSLDVRHSKPITARDANFELIGMLFNIALWLMRHAAKLASTSEVTMEDALAALKSLQNAAAVFSYIRNDLLGRIRKVFPPGSDLDKNILSAYMYQCLAEAQEIIIARAIELKHEPKITAALACETAVLYEKCKCGLGSLSDDLVGKWRTYCIFKASCYRAYAYCFHSQSLLKEDKGGDAILSAKEAQKYCVQANNAAKVYRSGSGAFFFLRRLQPFTERVLSAAQTENTMIYHQKVPESMALLALKPEVGMAEPKMPDLVFTHDQQWESAVNGFNTTRILEWMAKKEYKIKKKDSMKLHVIPEKPIYMGDKDPSNISGCEIS